MESAFDAMRENEDLFCQRDVKKAFKHLKENPSAETTTRLFDLIEDYTPV